VKYLAAAMVFVAAVGAVVALLLTGHGDAKGAVALVLAGALLGSHIAEQR
jgi:hypothetical protein